MFCRATGTPSSTPLWPLEGYRVPLLKRQSAALGRFQPPNFRLELEAQLRGLLVRQPVRHLRKDGAPVERAARIPWKTSAPRAPSRARAAVRRAPRPDRRDRRPPAFEARKLGLAFAEQVELSGHGRRFVLVRRIRSPEFARRRGLLRRLVSPLSPTPAGRRRPRRAARRRSARAGRPAAARARQAGRAR